jgi:hypothetical protein
MSSIGEKHRDSSHLCRCNYLFITHAATWLHYSYNTCIDKDLKTIGKWEEGITCRDTSYDSITGTRNR